MSSDEGYGGWGGMDGCEVLVHGVCGLLVHGVCGLLFMRLLFGIPELVEGALWG